jgi:hypothetical protein
MNKCITLMSVLFLYVLFSAPAFSGFQSQAITPVITNDPDQTIHLQPNTSAPAHLLSNINILNTLNNKLSIPKASTHEPDSLGEHRHLIIIRGNQEPIMIEERTTNEPLPLLR